MCIYLRVHVHMYIYTCIYTIQRGHRAICESRFSLFIPLGRSWGLDSGHQVGGKIAISLVQIIFKMAFIFISTDCLYSGSCLDRDFEWGCKCRSVNVSVKHMRSYSLSLVVPHPFTQLLVFALWCCSDLIVEPGCIVEGRETATNDSSFHP